MALLHAQMKRFHRAFSLIEVMVAAGLSFIILGILASILIPAMRASNRAFTRGDLQERATLLMERMARDINLCVPEGVGVLNNLALPSQPVVLSFQSILDISLDSRQVWNGQFDIYYWDPATSMVMRRTWEPVAGVPNLVMPFSNGQPGRPNQNQLLQMALHPGDAAPVCRDVIDFRVTHGGAGIVVASPIRIRMVLEHVIDSREKAHFEIQRTMAMRQAD